MEAERIVAFATSSGQLAYVLLENSRFVRWHLWRLKKGASTVARSHVRMILYKLDPSLVVIEDPWQGCRKRGESYALLLMLAQTLADEPVGTVQLRYRSPFKNRYEEAWALCERFPELVQYRPKETAFYESEPRSLLLFEAAALALEARENPPRFNVS